MGILGRSVTASVSSHSNNEEGLGGTKHTFLTQGASVGEEFARRSGDFSRRQLSLTDAQHGNQPTVPRQSSAGPQRRIDQPTATLTGLRPEDELHPTYLNSTPYPRPPNNTVMLSSPDWPGNGARASTAELLL